MTLRSGADYLASLRDSRDIWLRPHQFNDGTSPAVAEEKLNTVS